MMTETSNGKHFKMESVCFALVDTLAVSTAMPDAEQDEREHDSSQRAYVGPALAHLLPRERFIAEKRFMEDEPPSLAELGRQLGVSRERVRQIETRVIRKLRKLLTAENSLNA